MKRVPSIYKNMSRGIAKSPTEKSQKISDANRGHRHSPKTEFKKGQPAWNKGKKLGFIPKGAFKKGGRKPLNAYSFPKAAAHPNWKNGATPQNKLIRNGTEYKLWRTAVFERDGYTCIWCGIKGGNLNADHIKPFALFPELRLAIDNGRTLCVNCHKTTDTYAGRIKRT